MLFILFRKRWLRGLFLTKPGRRDILFSGTSSPPPKPETTKNVGGTTTENVGGTTTKNVGGTTTPKRRSFDVENTGFTKVGVHFAGPPKKVWTQGAAEDCGGRVSQWRT